MDGAGLGLERARRQHGFHGKFRIRLARGLDRLAQVFQRQAIDVVGAIGQRAGLLRLQLRQAGVVALAQAFGIAAAGVALLEPAALRLAQRLVLPGLLGGAQPGIGGAELIVEPVQRGIGAQRLLGGRARPRAIHAGHGGRGGQGEQQGQGGKPAARAKDGHGAIPLGIVAGGHPGSMVPDRATR
ncbi:hypothetical protein HMPREF0005_04550 [Achromobacter xylosoxidans C54]|nr:hypothetical protein HMPREF0005_04550 [Achromobacter xylosoxidans C54]